MSKKKEYETSADFLPFIHEDLETKDNLIRAARELKDKDGLEYLLSSTLIYSSLAEYLAQHFLQNLRFMAYRATYLRFNALTFIDQRDKKQLKGLGETISALEEFEFPDKQEVMKLLYTFNKSRNHFIHQFMNINDGNASKYNNDVRIIRECTEDLIDKLNIIYTGLGAVVWDNDVPIKPAEDSREVSQKDGSK